MRSVVLRLITLRERYSLAPPATPSPLSPAGRGLRRRPCGRAGVRPTLALERNAGEGLLRKQGIATPPKNKNGGSQ